MKDLVQSSAYPDWDYVSKNPFKLGSWNGFKVMAGVEGCGKDIYYFTVSSNKTLVIDRPLITEFSPIIGDYQTYLNLPGIILPNQAEEFFSKILSSLVEKFDIKYPVILDNDFSTWNAYKNQYWPRKYLIDIDGYIVYDHIGEGEYGKTEQKIQEALVERMAVLGEGGAIDQSLTKEVVIQGGPNSPETYFGAARNNFFGSGIKGTAGEQKNLTIPTELNPNTLYLSEDWDIINEFAQNNSLNAGVAYKYNAKDVFFVAQADNEIIVEALRDGKSLGAEACADIIKNSDGKTFVKIKEAHLYKIIHENKLETHTLKFIIPKSGLKAFTFTFG